jgi:hypothetical protein
VDSAEARLTASLRALWVAAGKPKLNAVASWGNHQTPPLTISDTSLSDWMNADRVAVPVDERSLVLLVGHLGRLAGRTEDLDQWKALRAAAWAETHDPGHRPRGPAEPARGGARAPARRPARPVPMMVPISTRVTVRRRALAERTVRELCEGPSCALAFAGAGGYGKTTLAGLVCGDRRVLDRFPGGILWVTVGVQPGGTRLSALIGDLIFAAAEERITVFDPVRAGAALGELLDRTPTLLVVDDVRPSGEQLDRPQPDRPVPAESRRKPGRHHAPGRHAPRLGPADRCAGHRDPAQHGPDRRCLARAGRPDSRRRARGRRPAHRRRGLIGTAPFDDPDPAAPPDHRHFYDQIAWLAGPGDPPLRAMTYRNAGMFDFAADHPIPAASTTQLSWRISGHFPLWCEFDR